MHNVYYEGPTSKKVMGGGGGGGFLACNNFLRAHCLCKDVFYTAALLRRPLSWYSVARHFLRLTIFTPDG